MKVTIELSSELHRPCRLLCSQISNEYGWLFRIPELNQILFSGTIESFITNLERAVEQGL